MSKEIIWTNYEIKHKFLWHYSGIYCLTFDRTSNYIFTGGDDGLVKVYSVSDDKLVATLSDGSENQFKEEMENICKSIDNVDEVKYLEQKMEKFAVYDIAISYDNTLLAAGKHSGLIPVWNLQTGQLVVKLDRHMFPISSLKFSSVTVDKNHNYLISTSEDGFMFFWKYNNKNYKFDSEPVFRRTKYDGYRAKNMCTTYSCDGLLIGIIYTFEVQNKNPKNKFQSGIRIFTLKDDSGPIDLFKSFHMKSHESCEYSLKFSNKSFRFASGCDNDIEFYIWSYDKVNKIWNKMAIDVNQKLGNKSTKGKGKSKKSGPKGLLFVEEIIWSCHDNYVITSLSNDSIKVWSSESGQLVQHFERLHKNKIVALESHPIHDHLFMSGGYDGMIIIHDIINGTIQNKFECSLRVENSEILNTDNKINPKVKKTFNPMIHECNFSSNGRTIASTDSWGNLTLFSLESAKENDEEIDNFDRLEQFLKKVDAGSDDESDDVLVPIFKPSGSEQLTKARLDYEIDLLNAIEIKDQLLSKTIEDRTVKDKETDDNKNTIDNKKAADNNSDIEMIDVDSEKKVLTDNKTPEGNKRKQMKLGKDRYKAVLNAIFENPNSIPFQAVDHLIYPTYRKEISNADICLSSIKEDIVCEDRYSLARFCKDMNLVFENSKAFYKDKDEKVYAMAVELEKFYENEMDAVFGDMWRQTHKKSLNKVSKKSDDKTGSDLDVSQASTSKSVFDESITDESGSGSKAAEKRSNLKVNKAKRIQRKVSQTIHNSSDSESPAQLKKGTQKSKPKALQQNNGLNKNKKRESDAKSSFKTKRTRADSKELEKPLVVNDLGCDLSDIKNEKINGDHEDSPDLNSSSSDESMSLEPIDLVKRGYIEELDIEEEEDMVVKEEEEEEKEKVTSQVIGQNSSVNGLKLQNISINDAQNESIVIKESPYFCIFCDLSFLSKSEAYSHYIMHLCPLKCLRCDRLFTTYDEFQNHNSQHSNNSTNIEWSRHYSDSIAWIEKFLNYQQTKDIESIQHLANNKCIVCERVSRYRPRSSTLRSSAKGVVPVHHLKEHLQYEPQYQCLICFLNKDQYLFCVDPDKAKEHLIDEHKLYVKTTEDVLKHFDPSIPKLDGIINKFD